MAAIMGPITACGSARSYLQSSPKEQTWPDHRKTERFSRPAAAYRQLRFGSPRGE